MIPDVGSTAYFTFTLRFETLNGVYRIRAETTFRDAISAGVSFADSLYIPAGLQGADFDADQPSYTSDRVVVLESVKDANTVYQVPESVFLNIPDPTIKEYFPLNMVVNLGVHENTQVILPLLDKIKDLAQASLGVTNPVYILTNPDNKVYLTNAEYDALNLARQANIQKLMPLSVQLAKANATIAAQAARIAAYENRIIEQSAG